MGTTADFKRGGRIEIDGEPYTIVDYSTQSSTARGGGSLIRTKLRNLRTGQLIDKAFKSGERVKAPDFEIRSVQFLYAERGETFVFMDGESYEQFELHKDVVAETIHFLRPSDEARALVFNDQCIGIEVPQTVELEVAQTDPGVKGDTVTNTLKPATLETGLEVQVPLFVEAGDRIVVDTRDSRYVRRA